MMSKGSHTPTTPPAAPSGEAKLELVTVSREQLDAILARQSELEKKLEQVGKINERASAVVEDAARQDGARSNRVVLIGLHTGCRYTDTDDGYDIQDGKVMPHAGRARITEMLSRTTKVDGEDVPVFVLAHPVAPRYPGDPIARARVYGDHDKGKEEKLKAAKRRSDAMVASRALQHRQDLILQIKKAFSAAEGADA
jgi:hypothetical protein